MGILVNRNTTIKEKRAKSTNYNDVDPKYYKFNYSKYYSIGEYYNSVRALDNLRLIQGLKQKDKFLYICYNDRLTVKQFKEKYGITLANLAMTRKGGYLYAPGVIRVPSNQNTINFNLKYCPKRILIDGESNLRFNITYLQDDLKHLMNYFKSRLEPKNLDIFLRRIRHSKHSTTNTYNLYKIIFEENNLIDDWDVLVNGGEKFYYNIQKDLNIIVRSTEQDIEQLLEETLSQYEKKPRIIDYQGKLKIKEVNSLRSTLHDVANNFFRKSRVKALVKGKAAFDVVDEIWGGTELLQNLINDPDKKHEVLKHLDLSDVQMTKDLKAVRGLGQRNDKLGKDVQNYLIDLYVIDEDDNIVVILQLKGRSANSNVSLNDSITQMADLAYLSHKYPKIKAYWVDIQATDQIYFTFTSIKNSGKLVDHDPIIYRLLIDDEFKKFMGKRILESWRNSRAAIDELNSSTITRINDDRMRMFKPKMQKVIDKIKMKYQLQDSSINVDAVSNLFENQIKGLKLIQIPEKLNNWSINKFWKRRWNKDLHTHYYQLLTELLVKKKEKY